MTETSRRFQLRFDPGVHTLRHVNLAAEPAQILNLARQINRFQEDELDKVVRVRVINFG